MEKTRDGESCQRRQVAETAFGAVHKYGVDGRLAVVFVAPRIVHESGGGVRGLRSVYNSLLVSSCSFVGGLVDTLADDL